MNINHSLSRICWWLSYSRFKMFRLSSSSTAGLWLSLLRKNTRITFWTILPPTLLGVLSSTPSAQSLFSLFTTTTSTLDAWAGVQSAKIRTSKKQTPRPTSTPKSGLFWYYNIWGSTSGKKSGCAFNITQQSQFSEDKKKGESFPQTPASMLQERWGGSLERGALA